MLVYLDLLALLNFAIDLALLYGVAAVTGRRTHLLRAAAAAALGAAYGTAAVMPWGAFLQGVFPSLITALLMVGIAFWPFDPRRGLTMLLWFYALGTAAGGLAALAGYRGSALAPAAGLWPGFVPPWWGAPVGALLVLILATGSWRAARRLQLQARHQVAIVIQVEGRRIQLPARVDTGHDAVDPLSGRPVTVVEAGAMAFLWGGEDASFDLIWNRLSQGPLAHRARLFPYRALGVDHGLLPALRVDRLLVHTGTGGPREHPGAVVALYPGRLGGPGSFRALLPAELLLDPVPAPVDEAAG